jgi:hypothetical protein
LLRSGFDCRLVIELGETLAAHDVVEAMDENVLQARLDDRSNGGKFAGDDAVAPDPCPVGCEAGRDQGADGE